MFRSFFPSLFFVALALFSTPLRAAEKLIIGMELGYPPFEMTDKQGTPCGVSVDLAHALGAHLGREVQIENMGFTGLIPSLKTGKIHLIISSMTANEERMKSINFSEPYLRTGLCILTGAKNDVKSLADLDQPGRTVAVKQGTTGQLFAVKQLKNAKVLPLDKENACVLEVVQGKVDGFIYDQMSVWQNWKKNAETTRALLQPIKEEAWAIGIRKGDDALRQQVNAFLAEFREKGGFKELGKRWLSEQQAGFEELGVPFVF